MENENTPLMMLFNYIFVEFELSREARYLVINIINFLKTIREDQQKETAKALLLGSIGIEAEEIDRFW